MQYNYSRNSPRGLICCSLIVTLVSGVAIDQTDAHCLCLRYLLEHVSCKIQQIKHQFTQFPHRCTYLPSYRETIIHKFIIYQVVQVLTHLDDLTFLRRGLQHGQMQWGPVQVVLLYTVGPVFGWRRTASKHHKSIYMMVVVDNIPRK
jgi:hypothetical protein